MRLAALRPESIRSKILLFAVLATLIPSLCTAWISYIQNKRSLTEKITGQLESVSSQIARELDLWVKESLYNLRVFASSYEVSENLAHLPLTPDEPHTERPALRRLNDYLNSVRERFSDYDELLVIETDGRVVATSANRVRAVRLPPDWLKEIRAGAPVVGDAYWDEAANKSVVMLAVPIRPAGGRLVGALTAKLTLRSVEEILKRFSPGEAGQAYVMTTEGGVIMSSRPGASDLLNRNTNLPTETTHALSDKEGGVTEYRGFDGRAVVGSLQPVPRLRWAVVAEIPAAEAYRQVIRLRDVTALLVAVLLLGIGLIAYVLGVGIVRPLDRLTEGAGKVAAGDLAVDLPVGSGGEVGYLTEVFNDMVFRLREGRQALDAINEALRKKNEELERLSVTDGLTGVYNRRYLMQALAGEVRRARRSKQPFALLMVDVDNFKKYNDTFGHLAGDEVLARLASVLRESIREVDCAARYGGEEFAVVLAETGAEGGVAVAERVRARLASETFAGGGVTVSVGVAEFPEHGDTSESLIANADGALYQAKREGRNRVVRPKRRYTKVAKRVRDSER